MVMTGNKRSSSVVKAGNAQPKKNLWKPEEDLILRQYVETHGEGNWATVSKRSGLKRGGKSCRLRWKNYLRPNIKRGDISQEEQDLIIRMHKLLGNRWSLIAGRLPGRTDNEVKNYWNTHLNKNISCCPAAGSKRKSTTVTDYSNDGINITKKENKIDTVKTSSTATTTTDDPMITNSTDRIPKDTSSDHQHQHHKEPNIGSMLTTTSTEESWFYDDMDLESPRELQYYQYYLPTFSSNFNAASAFDDELFIGYMDSFLLFD